MAYSILRLTAAATCCWPRVTFLPILFDMSDVVKTRTISCLWLIVLPVSEVPLYYVLIIVFIFLVVKIPVFREKMSKTVTILTLFRLLFRLIYVVFSGGLLLYTGKPHMDAV